MILRPLSIASTLGLLVFLIWGNLGCQTAPMTNTVVTRVDNPDGRSSAVLVERYYHAALSSNQFYLLLVPKEQNIERAAGVKNLAESSAFVGTLASKVQLRWESKDTLLVICDSCGLEAIDISKKLDHLGSTKIVYQGFPEHTAYS